LCLQQHGLDTGNHRLFKNFDIGDIVAPVDVEDYAETSLVEVLQETQSHMR